MIESEPGLGLFIGSIVFLNLGAQNRCVQRRYTDVKIDLD